MSDDKYKGKVGPEDAMSALDGRFTDAYSRATKQIMDAVLEFERVTGRVVDAVNLRYVDITTIHDTERQAVRDVQINFLPKPSEVAW